MKKLGKSGAIKQHCLECAGGTYKEVLLCPVVKCALYPFRFGVVPNSQAYREKIDLARRKWPNEAAEVNLSGKAKIEAVL